MPTIKFLDDGTQAEVAVGTSLLDYCLANTAPIDFGCTVGSCGTCRVALEEGGDQVNPMGDEERETVEMATDHPGARLACQLVVNGDIALRSVE